MPVVTSTLTGVPWTPSLQPPNPPPPIEDPLLPPQYLLPLYTVCSTASSTVSNPYVGLVRAAITVIIPTCRSENSSPTAMSRNTTSSTVVMIIKRQSYRTLFFTPYHSSIFPTCSLTSLFWSLAVTADNVLSALIIHQFQKEMFIYIDQLKTVQSFILYSHCPDLLLTSFNGQQPWSIHTSTQTC